MKPNFKPRKKLLYWMGGIFLFLVILNFALNFWIKAKVPAIIEEQNDTAYNLAFEKLNFSLLNSSLSLKGVSVTPKENFPGKLPIDFTADVEEIQVVGVNFLKLLRKKDLSAFSIKINNPEVTYYKSTEKDTIQSQSKLGSIIHVSHFKITDAYFKMFEADRKTKVSDIKDLDIELVGVNLSERTLEKDIPFTYKSFKLTCGDVFFQVNPLQSLKSSSFKITNNQFILNGFEISSPDSISSGELRNHNHILPETKAPTVTFTGLDWGYNQSDDFYFKAETLKFDSVGLKIYETRDRKKDSVSEPSNLIPFELDINKIYFLNAQLSVQNAWDIQNLNIEASKIHNKKGERITVENILLDNPQITAFQSENTKRKTKEAASEFIDVIQIKDLAIKNADFKLNKLNGNRNLLKVSNLNFSMKNIEVNPESYLQKIPFLYKNVLLTADALDYNPDNVYNLKTKNISFEDGNFKLNNFEMKPKVTRNQFVKSLKKEKDFYTITAKTIHTNHLDFGFNGKDLYIKIPDLNLETVHANIYRSKIPPDDPKKKLMYSKLLRDLPFTLEVKNIDLKNSKVEYEEETLDSKGAGKLTFSNFNANIKNVYSGFKKSSVPDVRADITTNFMNDSRLKAIWTFNPMNRSEKFNIKGNIYNFDAKKMTPFVKPYLHVTAEGNMREVHFNFTGNDINATGDFGVKYDDLKVTVYNPETGKVRKVVSTLGNFLVKSNTRDEYKEERIETVTRNQDRSFFNFFWNCVQQGLKQTVLVI